MHIVDLIKQRKTAKAFDPSYQLNEDEVKAVRALLRMSPSSTNAQPWHFFLMKSEESKKKVALAMANNFAYNEPKILNSSLVVVMCARTQMNEAYLCQVLDQETQDGRLGTEEARANQHKVRLGYVHKHEQNSGGLVQWSVRQLYIALGFLLLGAAELGIDTCPIEGFDTSILDHVLDLENQGLTSQVVVALGRKSDQDFNALLPKSRLDETLLITEL